jgi:GNAT superfamily N-acetyltransferase
MLRRADADDLSELVDLWMEMMRGHEAFDPRVVLTSSAPSDYQSYLAMHIRAPRSLVILTEEEGRIIGFCCAYVCQNLPMFTPAEFGFISDLAVTPDWQKRGIGSRMLEYVKDWLRRQDITCMQLQVYTNNASGKQFWHAKGLAPLWSAIGWIYEILRNLSRSPLTFPV